MLRTSAKVRKSKTGYVFKDVKEHYLRKEIGCGIKGCSVCKTFQTQQTIHYDNSGISHIYPMAHVLIPEENVLMLQIDLFENENIKNVVILQSVLSNIQKKNFAIYKRIQVILNINEKCFYVFNNDHHESTFTAQESHENDDAWNLRLLQKACCWYTQHLQNNDYEVVCITSNVSVNSSFDIKYCCSIHDYINSLVSTENLIDTLVFEEFENVGFDALQSKAFFPDYLAEKVIIAGSKSNRYFIGTYYQDADDPCQGKVCIPDSDILYTIVGTLCINRAFNNDLVAIEVLQLATSGDEVANEPDKPNFDIPDLIFTDLPSKNHGKIVSVLRRRSWKQYTGVVELETSIKNTYLFRASDSKIPLIMFECKAIESIKNKKICVCVDNWNAKYRYPQGHLVKILGDVGDKNVESNAILFELKIPCQNFSQNVMNCLPDLTKFDESRPLVDVEIILKREPQRKDLRHLNICSIDPPGCTDIDDALHCRLIATEPEEIYEIGIHIADVTHYVLPNTYLDQEAYRRGTTVYLVDRRIHMLPDMLSSNLCSLQQNEDRLAFSVLCYMNINGDMKETYPTKFTKSVIKSRYALTYQQAQEKLSDVNDNSDTSVMLKQLSRIMSNLRKKRFERGALFLDSAELSIEIVHSENCSPMNLSVKENFETNKIVEDCMLLANILVAKQIYKSFPNTSLLRNHLPPYQQNVADFYSLVSKKFKCDQTLFTLPLNEFLNKISTLNNDVEVNKVIKTLSIPFLKPATYISSGCHSFDSYFHYGLSEQIYTHFTSPIRRYPDIVVHRLLAAAISSCNNNQIQFYDSKTVQQMCEHFNRTNYSARTASRQSTILYLYYFLKNLSSIRREFAYITKIHDGRITVFIPSLNYHGIIRVKNSQAYCNIVCNPADGYIVVENRKINLFDRITVELSIDPTYKEQEKIKITIIQNHDIDYSC